MNSEQAQSLEAKGSGPVTGLKRSVGLLDVTMLGAGTAIGASIFSVLGPAVKVGGYGVLISVILGAAPMIVFGIVYAFMASAAPTSGASYEWQRRYLHPLLAFLIAWLRVLGSIALAITMARVLANYMGMVVNVAPVAIMFAAITIVVVLNYFGISMAARAQTILMFVLLAFFAVFILRGMSGINPLAKINSLAGGWLPAIAVLPLMIQLYLGIETATEIGDEVRNASLVIPLALIIAVTLTVVVYTATAATALILIGPARLAASTAPLAAAAQAEFGPAVVPFVVAAAVMALFKSLNAIFLVFTRYLYAMGRAGALPEWLGKIDIHRRTPRNAILVGAAAVYGGLLLPSNLVFLFLAISVPVMMKYLGTCLAALNVTLRHPAIYREAKVRPPKKLLAGLCLTGAVLAIAIATIGLGTDVRPYVLVGCWTLAGAIYYLISGRLCQSKLPRR